MRVEESAAIFGEWARQHDIILEDYEVDPNVFKCSIVDNGKDEATIENIMRETKVVLITFATQAGLNMDGMKLRYRVIQEDQRAEAMEKCKTLMLRLLGKMMGTEQ